MTIDSSWQPFYDIRRGVAIAGANALDYGNTLGDLEIYIKWASCRQTVGGAKPTSLGVVVGIQFYPFATTLAPAALELISDKFEFIITDTAQLRAEFLAMAGAEVMELFVHGYTKRKR